MSSISYKPNISKTLTQVRNMTFYEKSSSLQNLEQIDSFLDRILDLKKLLNSKTEKINGLIDEMEKLTWFSDVDQNELQLINDLISSAKDLRTTLIRLYFSTGVLRNKDVANQEIQELKNSIDDLKESCEDLESRFFYLPEMPEFKETSKELSLL